MTDQCIQVGDLAIIRFFRAAISTYDVLNVIADDSPIWDPSLPGYITIGGRKGIVIGTVDRGGHTIYMVQLSCGSELAIGRSSLSPVSPLEQLAAQA